LKRRHTVRGHRHRKGGGSGFGGSTALRNAFWRFHGGLRGRGSRALPESILDGFRALSSIMIAGREEPDHVGSLGIAPAGVGGAAAAGVPGVCGMLARARDPGQPRGAGAVAAGCLADYKRHRGFEQVASGSFKWRWRGGLGRQLRPGQRDLGRSSALQPRRLGIWAAHSGAIACRVLQVAAVFSLL